MMIDECLEHKTEFGIIWLAEEDLKPVGCACAIERLLERTDDGRMNIVARGTRPFRLLRRQDDMPYPAGEVEFLEDRTEDADDAAAAAAHEVYAELVVQATDAEPDPEQLARMGAYEMAATMELPLDAKQGMLDLRSENARMRLVTRLLKATNRRIEMVARVQERARTNGKMRFG